MNNDETLEILNMDEIRELCGIGLAIVERSPWMVVPHASGKHCYYCNGKDRHWENCLYLRAVAVHKEVQRKTLALTG